MKFDLVHDSQKTFRSILKAFSFPGRIQDLSSQADAVDFPSHLFPATLALALSLVDAETTFSFQQTHGSSESTNAIRDLCSARPENTDKADFVFVFLREHDDLVTALTAIEQARSGSLIDPQLGASIFVEVPCLNESGAAVLEGPGIDPDSLPRRFSMGLPVDIERTFLAARSLKNKEFPLGVDFIFTDPAHRLAALPRTTRLRFEEA